MRPDKDTSSKWLLEHHGRSILRLDEVIDVVSCRAGPAEIVHPRQLPDGLLEVVLQGQPRPVAFVVEIATYPEARVVEQLRRDALTVWLDRRVLPEVLAVVLHPKGRYRVPRAHDLASPLGTTRLRMRWHVVELWKKRAADLLAADDPGLIPWVPLTRFQGTSQALIQQCRDRIEQQAAPEERLNLLAVTQVMTKLRFGTTTLLTLLGGERVMIESTLFQELLARQRQKDILRILRARFGTVSAELEAEIGAIEDEAQLDKLIDQCVLCPDVKAFRKRMRA